MTNSLLTINLITREAIRLWRNSNAFLQNIDTQYDNSFAKTGAKIGETLRIRLPNDFTVATGQAAQIQDTTEQSTTLTLATQKHVAVAYSTLDRTLSLDEVSERVLAPMVNNLAGNVAQDIMQGSEGGVCNFVANTDSNGNIISPVATTYLDADAILTDNSAGNGPRKVVNSPRTNARVVSSLTGLLNPAMDISKQYKTGRMFNALGFDWMIDPTVIAHTAGTFSAGTVNGANQTGTTLVVNAITGSLVAGDIITISNVLGVNHIFKASQGTPKQFVVTASVNSGATSISIFPAIVPAVSGNQVQYQTVTASPANAAPITLAFPAGATFLKNIAYAKDFVTMATADLVLPSAGIVEGAREQFDGVSMRMITDYDIGTDELITRLDILYGYLYVRPEWGVIVADQV